MGAGAHGQTLLLSFSLDTKEKSDFCIKEGKGGGRDGNKQLCLLILRVLKLNDRNQVTHTLLTLQEIRDCF